MSEEANKASELDHEETARFVVDVFHRLILHHGLWFAEVKHQMGMERALELLAEVGEKSLGLQLRHLGDLFGFAVKDGVPAPPARHGQGKARRRQGPPRQELAGQ